MTAALVALIAAISISTWVYVKFQNRAGSGNAGTALKGTAIVFVITFVVVLTVGLTIFH